jgi:prephenate dehydrogenase
LAEEIACAVGAQPLWLDADRHDRWVACTSHLPYLLANALAASIPQEAASLVGPGFRSTARLAGSSVEMMRDILQTNQNSVLNALQQVRGRLDTLCALLESSQWDKLEATLADGKIQYERLVK